MQISMQKSFALPKIIKMRHKHGFASFWSDIFLFFLKCKISVVGRIKIKTCVEYEVTMQYFSDILLSEF